MSDSDTSGPSASPSLDALLARNLTELSLPHQLGKLVRGGLGLRHYDGNTTLCMAAAVAGYKRSFGSDGPPGSYADLAEAERLARLAQPLRAKVNLIPYNTVEGLPWVRPGEDQQEAFLQVLRRRGITATLRREKGHDIDAACGQLAASAA